MKQFKRKNELPRNCILDTTYIIFENSLRNYARNICKSQKKSALEKNMYQVREDDLIVCNCVGVCVSLIEILYQRYDSIIWVVKKDGRVKIHEVQAVHVIFPNVKFIWV